MECSAYGRSIHPSDEFRAHNLMRFIICLGFSLIGAVLVGGIGLGLSDPPNWVAFTLFAVGGLLGIGATRLFYRYVAPPPKQQSKPQATSALQTHAPFADRLQRFSGVDDSQQDFDDSASTMPFWTRNTSHVPTPPRPPQLMRRILLRIRAIIRGASSTPEHAEQIHRSRRSGQNEVEHR